MMMNSNADTMLACNHVSFEASNGISGPDKPVRVINEQASTGAELMSCLIRIDEPKIKLHLLYCS